MRTRVSTLRGRIVCLLRSAQLSLLCAWTYVCDPCESLQLKLGWPNVGGTGLQGTGRGHSRAELLRRRQDRLQRAEAAFHPLPFDGEAARAYGRIYAAVVAKGRKARGARAVDLLIAATAYAAELPLYTRNPDDFRGLEKLVAVVAV